MAKLISRPVLRYWGHSIDDRHYKNDENLQIGVNGFVPITLQGNRLDVDYFDVYGAKIFSEKWIVKDGVLARLPLNS